jgi:NitT/TauT family transport system substrate-binding protein
MIKKFAVLAVLATTVLAGCGTGSGTSTNADGTTTIKVGTLPISALAPLYLGAEKGIFGRHKLKIEPQVAQSGASIIPAVVSGQQQFGFANCVSLMVGRDKGLPLKIVSQGSGAGPGESQKFEGVIVSKSSPIRTPADLAGKTIAVNAVNDIGGLLIGGALAKQGVDPKSIKYVEIGFPNVNAAVDAGRVDAAYQTEPFLDQAVHDGDRVVLYQYPVLADQITIANYFTSEAFASKNPEVVKEFRDAMNESLTYAAAHPAEVRQVVTTFTKIPKEAADSMVLPAWNTDLDPNRNGLDLVGQLAASTGLISKQPDFGEFIER